MQFKNRFLIAAASAAGVSVLVQVLAFLRQLLIAAYFGVGRDFDIYVTLYSIATIIVFAFGSIFDSIAVPHLVRARENKGEQAARELARSIFRLSLWLSGAISLIFLIAVPLLAPIFATGFSSEERGGLLRLAWYFLPWTLVCVPYYAAAARHKMEWRFNRVFVAEIIIVVVSIGFLVFRHTDIRMLPFAYASGYAVGLMQLIVGAALLRRGSNILGGAIRDVLRNVGELFVANQTGGLTSLVDRHIQSFLATGGIGALSYSSQIIASLSTLLTFREIYMVPLARQDDRDQRLERLLSGLLLLAVPLAGFVACFAPEIVTLLLQRGRFDAAATELTTEVLRIGAFGMVSGTVFLPLLRMFQILDRIRLTHALFISLAVEYALFGYTFVVALGWGVRGVALMQVASSAVSTLIAIGLLGRCGVRLNWRRVGRHLTLAVLVSAMAFIVTALAVSNFNNIWLRLGIGGPVYGLAVLLPYLFARAQLRDVVFGLMPSPAVRNPR
jgi:putative peptidoglycan lipid II flippase